MLARPTRDARATRFYHDFLFDCDAVKVLPNEYYVTNSALMITTVLGSCVAACVHDPVSNLGGMNHFMLPDGDLHSPASASMRYGAYAMDVLIEELLKAGAARERLQAKVFGGAAVLANMPHMNIGERNAAFVLKYLALEGIPVAAQDLGGNSPRRINYFPRDGQVQMRKLTRASRARTTSR
jgi:chemotaxis protein CheD